MTQGTDHPGFYDYDEDEFAEEEPYEPTPRPRSFEERIAAAAPYGITVTLLDEKRWPVIACSTWHCPQCGEDVEVRCEKETWELTEQAERIRGHHSARTCETIRRERGPHLQWGIDYGSGEVQRQETEEEARFYASGQLGGGSYQVVCREVGGWQPAPAAAAGTEEQG